jgi:peptidoglycan/LPS O-acetylase OafA/YrhL
MDQHLSRPFSVYLDLVRVSAALSVLLFHAAGTEFGGNWMQPIIGHAGTLGVVAFFVLSGFVISYASAVKETEFGTYIINRFARLWSVVIPALALTVVADFIGRHVNPAVYPAWYLESVRGASAQVIAAAKLITSGLFVNQIWNLQSVPLSNGPFWSLSYEFWYYVCFGCFVLVPGRKGIWLGVLAFLIMGPKIWILSPVWLLGVLVFRLMPLAKRLPLIVAIVAFASPLAMHWIIKYGLVPNISGMLVAELGDRFVGFSTAIDLAVIFGPLMAANIFAAISLSERCSSVLLWIEWPVRSAAGATLSMYLYHYPLLFMFGALFAPRPSSTATNLIIIVSVLALVFLFRPITEGKKNLVRSWLQATFDAFQGWLRAKPKAV